MTYTLSLFEKCSTITVNNIQVSKSKNCISIFSNNCNLWSAKCNVNDIPNGIYTIDNKSKISKYFNIGIDDNCNIVLNKIDFDEFKNKYSTGCNIAVYDNSINEVNYWTWKQFHTFFNKEKAFPKNKYPNTYSEWMYNNGCFYFSLSYLLRLNDIVLEKDENKFNPLTLFKKIKTNDMIDSYGMIKLKKIHKIFPIKYIKTIKFSVDKLEHYMNHYLCIVITEYITENVSLYKHTIVPYKKIYNGEILILDPGQWIYYLSDYTPLKILLFEKLG